MEEDININNILTLATDTETEILMYKEKDIWHEGDYAYAVLGKRKGWVEVAETSSHNFGVMSKFFRLFLTKPEPVVPPRSQRLKLIHERLGQEYYPNIVD